MSLHQFQHFLLGEDVLGIFFRVFNYVVVEPSKMFERPKHLCIHRKQVPLSQLLQLLFLRFLSSGIKHPFNPPGQGTPTDFNSDGLHNLSRRKFSPLYSSLHSLTLISTLHHTYSSTTPKAGQQ